MRRLLTSKAALIASTSTVAIGGGASAGVVLFNLFSKTPDIHLPDDFQTLKGEGFGKGCVPDLFSGLQNTKGDDLTVEGEADVDANFLKDGGQSTNGCLVVNWDNKTKDTSGGGAVDGLSGTIRFLWAVGGRNSGFVVFLLGKTSEPSDKKLKWEGVAYGLKHSEGSWKLSKKKEVSSDKAFSKDSSDNQFPSSGSALGSLKDKSYWDFFEKKDLLDKVISGTDDDISADDAYRGYWTWRSGAGESKLEDWTKDLNTWWAAIFTNDKWDMANAVKELKGVWTKEKELTGPGLSEEHV